jgi:hypothetical protein
MPEDVYGALWALKRNDMDGALRVARELKKKKALNPATVQVLLMLQDDSYALMTKLAELRRDKS